ncbi:MAG: hypothetical protein ACOYI6_04375 [Christensenellales bacterium]|jgi:hypothetical protein
MKRLFTLIALLLVLALPASAAPYHAEFGASYVFWANTFGLELDPHPETEMNSDGKGGFLHLDDLIISFDQNYKVEFAGIMYRTKRNKPSEEDKLRLLAFLAACDYGPPVDYVMRESRKVFEEALASYELLEKFYARHNKGMKEGDPLMFIDNGKDSGHLYIASDGHYHIIWLWD